MLNSSVNERRLKVLILPSWYPPDGGWFFQEQAHFISAAGADVAVAYRRAVGIRELLRNHEFPGLLASGCRVLDEDGIPTFRDYWYTLPSRLRREPAGAAHATRRTLRKVISTWGTPDLVHAHSLLWAGYAAAALRESYGIPYVVTEHRGIFGLSIEASRPQILPWHRPFLSKAVNDAERIIMVGSKLAAQIEPLRKSDVPLEVIPNGVDTDFFVPSDSGRGRDFTFVFVGNLLREKGVHNLLAAFVALKQRSRSIRLIMVGDGPERSGLARAAVEARVSDAVEFTGQMGRDGVRANLTRGHALVLPSDWEGQGVAALEAMSMGLPVIATDGAPPELFPGWAGRRIPIRDVDALVDAMSTVMENYSVFDSTRIRAFAITHYDFRSVAERIVNVYRCCLASPRVHTHA